MGGNGRDRVGEVDASSGITGWPLIDADRLDWCAGPVISVDRMHVRRRLASEPELFLNDRLTRAVRRVDCKSRAWIPMGHPHHANGDNHLVIRRPGGG